MDPFGDEAAMLPQCDAVRQPPSAASRISAVINLSLNCNLYITRRAYGDRQSFGELRRFGRALARADESNCCDLT
jgi:hypothetical protein